LQLSFLFFLELISDENLCGIRACTC
jgi:hypothetical protein